MSTEPVDLFSQQAANRRRSRWLVVAFILFFAWLGFGGDWIYYQLTVDAPSGEYRHLFPWFGLLLSAVGGGLAWHGWTHGAKDILWSVGAREIQTPATPEEAQLVNVVEEMAIASGLPRPRIHIVPDADPNAFAAGRDPASSHVAVTQGLLEMLSRDELQAVVAHEMGHVKNLDVQLMTLLAGLVGAIALVADGMGRFLRHGARFGGGGSRGGKKGKGLGPVLLIIIAIWLISWLLAPLVTRLLALGVSRKREFLADAMSAQFTRNPMALATALEKIEGAHAPTTSIKHAAAHLCIADPLGRRVSAREGAFADALGTHPPMSLRVSRLKAMAYQEMKRAGNYMPPSPSGARLPA
jgi:heat shock protein HtpX